MLLLISNTKNNISLPSEWECSGTFLLELPGGHIMPVTHIAGCQALGECSVVKLGVAVITALF